MSEEKVINRSEVMSGDSGFNEMVEKIHQNGHESPKKVFSRAVSEEPQCTANRLRPRRKFSFKTSKNIFVYLEQHGMDAKKPTNWWIAEEEEEEMEVIKRPVVNRALSEPGLRTFTDTNVIDNTTNDNSEDTTEPK